MDLQALSIGLGLGIQGGLYVGPHPGQSLDQKQKLGAKTTIGVIKNDWKTTWVYRGSVLVLAFAFT